MPVHNGLSWNSYYSGRYATTGTYDFLPTYKIFVVVLAAFRELEGNSELQNAD